MTDPESRLLRKGPGKEARLTFAAHALMDNRHSLLTDLSVTPSVGVTEPAAALALLARQHEQQLRPKSVGGDKGYHTRDFVAALRQRGIKPHVARKRGHTTPGLDGRTSRSPGYRISQIVRKRIEQVFGWGKTIGGLRKTRLREWRAPSTWRN